MVLRPIGFRPKPTYGCGGISSERGTAAPASGNDRGSTEGVTRMNCEEFDHLLDPYLDRELDPGQIIRLEQHLSDCPVCRSLVQECLDFDLSLDPTHRSIQHLLG